MSISQIEALYNAAADALDRGDYDTAIAKALACKMRLAATPNLNRSLAGGGMQGMQWANAMALDGFIAECRKLKTEANAAANGPMQFTKIVYERAELLDQ